MSLTAPSQTPNQRRLGPRYRRTRRQFVISLGVVLLLMVVLGGVGANVLQNLLDPGDPVAGVTAVILRDGEFSPAAIQVPMSSVVTWR